MFQDPEGFPQVLITVCDLNDPYEHPGPHLEECNWSPEYWNNPENWSGYKVSWNAPICEHCWWKRNGERRPVRVKKAPAEVCTDCGEATRSGIYHRLNPDKQTYKHWEEEE